MKTIHSNREWIMSGAQRHLYGRRNSFSEETDGKGLIVVAL